MYRTADALVVSPSDLVGFVACAHLTALSAEVAAGRLARPERDDPMLEVLSSRGLAHERRWLARLRAEGREVVEIAGGTSHEALREQAAQTLDALRAGAEVVYQAAFLDERGEPHWRGHADFLYRVPRPSALGDHAYEPVDGKLARQARPDALLQLCVYADLLAQVQGVAPERVGVVGGGGDLTWSPLTDVEPVYAEARERFLAALPLGPRAGAREEGHDAVDAAGPGATYPEAVAHCRVCAWLPRCAQRRHDDDDLSLVAGVSRRTRGQLRAAGITTTTALAQASAVPPPVDTAVRPPAAVTEGASTSGGGAQEWAQTYARVHRQARLQVAARAGGPPPYELLVQVDGGGLAALPPPDAADLYLDLEGDPFVGDAGLEYLFGLGWTEPGGGFGYRAFWAHEPGEERQAVARLVDALVGAHLRAPGLHVYHYAPYETSALTRLATRHEVREEEVEELLRDGVLVDLYRVVRESLAIGTPSYSLKRLEALHLDGERGAIADGGSSIVAYERWLETRDPQILAELEDYNRLDCLSTRSLRNWLLTLT